MKRTNYILTILTSFFHRRFICGGFLLTLFLLTINTFTFSQGCLPEGITFTTQQQIDDFQINYPGCTEIEGDVEISTGISNLNGLSILSSIGGDLVISNTQELFNLTGLDNLNSISGGLYIQNNMDLSSLSALLQLTFIGGDVVISNMVWLSNLIGLSGITSMHGNLYLDGLYELTSISALFNINSIEGNFRITNLYLLPNLNGLGSLTVIGGNFEIENNTYLESLTGTNNLISIGGDLNVYNNSSLTQLSGLANLGSIGGSLILLENNLLGNISEFNVLDSIGGSIVISYNNALSSLIGLDNIEPGSIMDLTITNNSMLSDCDVWSICQYLTIPTGSIIVYNNNTGCNSPEEVELACLTGNNEIIKNENVIKIFPNPAKNNITMVGQSKVKETLIYNQTGQLVLFQESPDNTLDISNIPAGLYFIEVNTKTENHREKLIIK